MSTYSDASLILPVAPEYKAGKIYSLKPTDGSGDFDFTRASKKHKINSDLKLEIINNNVPAFNYDAIGGCPVLNTEPQATNLITYPISFGNSYWTKDGAEINGDPSTAGANLVANGGMETGGSVGVSLPTNWTVEGSPLEAYKSSTIKNSGSYSIYVENQNGQGIKSDVFSFTAGKNYELTAWIYVVSGSSTIFASRTNPSIIDFNVYASATAGVWQKITTTSQALTTGTSGIKFLQDGAGTTIFYVDDVSVKEVQGYSAPSVDFPTSAFKLVENSLNAQHYIVRSLTSISSSYYTGSVFVKAAERFKIGIRESGNSGDYATFDLSTGLKISDGGTPTSSITHISDGWYKISLKPDTTSIRYDLEITILSDSYTTGNPSTSTYTGDGTSGVYIFMAQVEQGSVATSPTFTDTTLASEGSTTTRLADDVSKTGVTSIIGQTEGSFFIDMVVLSDNNISSNMFHTNKSVVDSVSIVKSNSTKKLSYSIYANSVLVFTLTTTNTYEIGDRLKILLIYKSGDNRLFVNGIKEDSNTTTFTFSGALDGLFLNDATTYFAYQQADNFNSFEIRNSVDYTDAEAVIKTTL